jgi:hypothetical protein
VAAIWVAVSSVAAPSAVDAASNPTPNQADFNCVVPALPHGIRGAASSSTRLSGPAVAALVGGAARHGFSLDGGGLVVKPPRPGYRPLLSAHQALCGATASTGGLSGPAAQGIAVGYGQVSVSAKFFPVATSFPFSGNVASDYPTVKSFSHRLAWLVVVHTNPVSFSCPAESAPMPSIVPPASDHGYEVFMIDARTGADALVYQEGGPGGCKAGSRIPPTVGVVGENVSVPWTLDSRDPDGYSGTISASVLPCDRYPDTVLVDQGSPSVEVPVTRPFGPSCGPSKTVTLSLHAAVVTADLPAVIGHDPVGLVTNLAAVTRPALETPPTTTTTSPPLVMADASSNGHTLVVKVGDVVTVAPLPGAQGTSFTNPVVSNNPAILGPLTTGAQPLVAEFRAWKEGTAELTVPQSACVHPGSDQVPCNGPFVVHVVVR